MPNFISSAPNVDNPFNYGTAVTGKNFAGRDREIGELLVSIKSGRNAILHSDKRMGKSSILAELATRHSDEYIFVHLDLRGISDAGRFAESFARRTLHAAFPRTEEYVSAIWEDVRSVRLRLSLLGAEELMEMARGRSGKTTLPQHLGRPALSEPRMCRICGMPLKWIDEYRRFYCYKCKKYVATQRVPKYSIGARIGMSQDLVCLDCGGELTFIHKFGEYYCEVCRKYPLVEYRAKLAQTPTKEDLSEALDLPQKVAEKKRLDVVVMLDEIQELLTFDSADLLKALAEKMGSQQSVHYILSGSRWHSISTMFLEKDSPMHRVAHPVDLRALPEEELQDFLAARFRSGGGRLGKEAAERISGVSRGHPYYAQQLAHELFHISRSPSLEDVESAIALTLERHSLAFSLMWDSVKSPLHRRYLIGLATEPGVPRGKDFIRRHGLKSRSHVQRIEKQLEARGMIANGEIVDPMFTLWLKGLEGRV